MASTLVSGRRGWREYWANKTTPLHARETEADFRALAGELRLLYAGHRIDSVLEVGCGNGAMFTQLGFDAAPRYVGIDFSQAMLDSFGERVSRRRTRGRRRGGVPGCREVRPHLLQPRQPALEPHAAGRPSGSRRIDDQ